MNRVNKFVAALVLMPVLALNNMLSAQTNQSMENKVNTIFNQLTLEQKIGQMTQIASTNGDEVPKYVIDAIKEGRVGSILNAGTPKAIEKIQKIVAKESPNKIPLIIGRDVIHGYKTIFPIPLGQAASWNRKLVETGANIAGKEAYDEGINWTFAPMIDISRDPRWGRIAESLGEDPYLTAELGAAMVVGFQGNELSSEKGRIAACAKHFIGYGATENGKDYNAVSIPDYQLWNTYLPPFKAALDAGVGTFMTAFNDINGIPASANQFLLKEVLRDKWNFDGFVVSDWESMSQMINQGYSENLRDVALQSASAQLDMEMVSSAYQKHLKELIESGEIDIEVVNTAVKNILSVKVALGLFEQEYNGVPKNTEILSATHKAEAKKMAIESLVLLKNENALPLKIKDQKIGIVGPLADAPAEQVGTWSLDAVIDEVETPLNAFQEAFGDQIVFAQGLENARSNNTDQIQATVDSMKGVKDVIVFAGEDAILSGEGHSRAFIHLPGAQEALIDALAEAGKNIILVVQAGRPLTLGTIEDKVKAILYAWHPGTMGGPAILDVITGKVTPSGKLPVTFPRTLGQVPIYYSSIESGRPANPQMLGIPTGTPLDPVGLTNNYLDVSVTPAYAFGYGLSYTSFSISKPKFSNTELVKGERITVTVEVKNTGKYEGAEVVQLYIHDKVASYMRPKLELKGFEKVYLAPGESKKVTFEIGDDQLSFFDKNGNVLLEKGKFEIFVGNASDNLASEIITLKNIK
ncbi:glycoside hydrolase family 3 N-terminal domain-containing protein [Flammeovirga sp. EKP202]|uniref:glycoside hydrolase family 3 N-terminal domain-containing protein n=1 Tax=Flammeovirga sp. EKP202 TaxID=2770592 RepID=UPI00165F2313|nr:glycoside hydrolase family 3 N-terminal domain-containing protein [Flammeovirga sp. EKP202]MBD0404372.1 glycoside hydrolase family 3 C-terminal domain-containing protein [Flammeovirga sp. EKP202]